MPLLDVGWLTGHPAAAAAARRATGFECQTIGEARKGITGLGLVILYPVVNLTTRTPWVRLLTSYCVGILGFSIIYVADLQRIETPRRCARWLRQQLAVGELEAATAS